VAKFGGKLNKQEQEQLLFSFPGKEGGSKGVRLDISRMYDMKYTKILKSLYSKVDYSDAVGLDEPTDEMGYLGKN